MSSSKNKKRSSVSQTNDSTSDDDSRTSSFSKSPKRRSKLSDPETMKNKEEEGLSDLSSSSSSSDDDVDDDEDLEGADGREDKGDFQAESIGNKSNDSTTTKSQKNQRRKRRKHLEKIRRKSADTREETPESDQDFLSDLGIDTDSDNGADLIINLSDDKPAPTANFSARNSEHTLPTTITTTTTNDTPTTTTSPTTTTTTTTTTATTLPHTTEQEQPSIMSSNQTANMSKKASGAIPISMGLKLGRGRGGGIAVGAGGRGGLKIGRPKSGSMLFSNVQTAPAVEVVDYSTTSPTTEKKTPPKKAPSPIVISSDVESSQSELKTKQTKQRPKLENEVMVIDSSDVDEGNETSGSAAISLDSNDFTAAADGAVLGKSSGVDDEMEEDDNEGSSSCGDGEGSDSDSSMASVDSITWRRQRLYHYRQVTPELLKEGAKALFKSDESIEEAKVRIAAGVPGLTKLVEKHHICEVCTERHPTSSCHHLRCEHCNTDGEHFSFNCPTIATKSPKHMPCTICKAEGHANPSHTCSHVWRVIPGSEETKIRAKIPVFCYYCGQEGHFGDNCTISRGNKNMRRISVWSRDAAKEFTAMRFSGDVEINPFKNFGQSKDIPIQIESDADDGEIDENGEEDEDEDGWFASRKKQVKEKIPDSKFTGMKTTAELPIAPRRGPGDSYRGGGGGGRGGLPPRPPSPDRYGDRNRRRSRSPPSFRGRGGGAAGRGGSYRDRQPVQFGMGRGRGRGGHQPPLPSGPPPSGPPGNMSSSREYYRPGGTAGKKAWQQFRR